jgi:coenzyme F420-reducing hydrogenase alpha subunit
MRIRIKHLARIEGHAGFIGHLLNGDVKRAKIEVSEGARLIEGILVGRHFSEAPIITARICGICPVIHNITSIKAIEDAFGIKVKPEIELLRKLMLVAQWIHSHTLHLFFLSLPDFLNYSSDLSHLKKYSRQTQWALNIREFGNKVIEVVGGRAIHPIATEVGGFKKYPAKSELETLYRQSAKVLSEAVKLANFFKKLKYPEFKRPTTFVSLHNTRDYAIYDGKIKVNPPTPSLEQHSASSIRDPEMFFRLLRESHEKGEVVKKVKYGQQVYMVGALARVNNNVVWLNKEAKKVLRGHTNMACNTFYNVLAQAVEVVHGVEECQKLLRALMRMRFDADKNTKIKIRAGVGLATCEAPRGTLYHYYEIDKNGLIKKCNIIPPTAQFLNNIEEDLKIWLPQIKKLSAKERENKIKMLIRAYDPCITCATH